MDSVVCSSKGVKNFQRPACQGKKCPITTVSSRTKYGRPTNYQMLPVTGQFHVSGSDFVSSTEKDE